MLLAQDDRNKPGRSHVAGLRANPITCPALGTAASRLFSRNVLYYLLSLLCIVLHAYQLSIMLDTRLRSCMKTQSAQPLRFGRFRVSSLCQLLDAANHGHQDAAKAVTLQILQLVSPMPNIRLGQGPARLPATLWFSDPCSAASKGAFRLPGRALDMPLWA